MVWLAPRTFVDGELMSATYHNDIVDHLEYLKGIQTDQEEIELEAALSVADDIVATKTDEFLEVRTRNTGLGGNSGTFQFSGRHASAVASGDAVQIIFSLREESSSTLEDLAMIRFRKNAAIQGRGAISFIAASGGAFGSPQAHLHPGGKSSFGTTTSPTYTVLVDGDVNADGGFYNMTLWESQAPNAYLPDDNDVIITEQFISTLATGMMPFDVNPLSPVCKNLNADSLEGETWPSTTYSDTGTSTLVTAATDYSTASQTTGAAGLYLVIGECTVSVATNDTDAVFSCEVPGAPAPSTSSGHVVGEKVHLSSCALYQAGAAEALDLLVSKDSGTGSSTVAGSIVFYRITA